MQRITVILLLITLHAQPVANGIVVLDFLMNQEYIKEFLCINKKKLKLACNGKCYLMQQLKETRNEKEQEFPVLLQNKFEFILTHYREKEADTVHILRKKEPLSCHKNNYAFLFEKNILRPPII